MAQDIVGGLFGPQPWEINRANQAALAQAADKFAAQKPMEQAMGLLYRGGAGLAQAGAGMLGMEDPAIAQAQARQQALSGLDISSPESIMAAAQRTADPQLRMRLMMMADQKKKEQLALALEAKKIEREDFRMGEEFKWKKEQKIMELEQRMEAARLRSEDSRYSADERREAAAEANRTRLLIAQLMQQMKASAAAAKPAPLTKGQAAVDSAFGKDYADYVAGGGFADVEKQLSQLGQVAAELEKPGNDFTGPAVGLMPEKMRAFTNPQAVDAQNKVEEVAQRNLRLVLGAQFTQVEGERLIARAYNPQLPPEDNAKRVRALIKQIRTAAETKESAAKYFEENGTLTGWTGKMPTVADFERAIDDATQKRDGKQAPAASGLPPGAKLIGQTPQGVPVYQTPDGKKWVQ